MFSWGGRRHRLLLVLVLVAVILVVATQSGWLGKGSKVVEQSQPGLYPVASYDDGDTIVVNMSGHFETIRFIGVDTPETHDPRKPIQCYGKIAAAFTKSTIEPFGKVRLQADPLDTNRDRYGRLLRYIYLPDGTLLDELLIKQGYGFAYLGFPFEKSAEFAADQAQAQTDKLGLWGKCKPFVNEFGGYSSNPAT